MSQRPSSKVFTGAYRKPLIASLLVAITLVVYWQVGGHGFVPYDDPDYVTANGVVKQGLTAEGIAWAFRTSHVSNWHPLTWLSHMADVELFGVDAGWHHRVNLLLHCLNTVLLFLALAEMTGAPWRSAAVAALFAVHPLHVESVAWVAERKDLLCAFFWMLSVIAYVRFVRRGGIARYSAVALFLALALLSKPMAVTLPFALIVLDYWPLARIRELARGEAADGVRPVSLARAVVEKIPFFALSLASCAATYAAQAAGRSTAPAVSMPLWVRAANGAESYVMYLVKTVWPVSLSAFYPHPWIVQGRIAAWQAAACAVLLLAVTIAVLGTARRRPYLPAGWFWYLGTLVPVIGLVQVGSQAMADRYTYLPLVGIFIMAAWGLSDALEGWRLRPHALGVLGSVSLLALMALAGRQASYWRNGETLYRHGIEATRDNWMMQASLGAVLIEQGRIDEAKTHLGEALRTHPLYDIAHHNLGVALLEQGRFDDAAAHLRTAIRISPYFDAAHNDLGLALGQSGRLAEAAGEFREALRFNPGNASYHNNLGYALLLMQRPAEAAPEFREALRLDPGYGPARENLKAAEGSIARP